jgi:hypothetical protein
MYIGLMILLGVLSLVLEAQFGSGGGNLGTAIVPAMAAAMFEGDRFVTTYHARPHGGAMWRATLQMSVLVMGISLILFAGVAALDPSALAAVATLPTLVWAIMLVVILAVIVIPIRIGYGLGARSAVKRLGA